MPPKKSTKAPVRKLTFKSPSPGRASKVKTLTSTYEVAPGDETERISYTISYSGAAIAPGTPVKDVAETLSSALTSAISTGLSEIASRKSPK